MGGKRSIGGALRGLASRLLVRSGPSRRAVEKGLRRILDESASTSCCSIDKVAHLRGLIEPARDVPDAGPKRP